LEVLRGRTPKSKALKVRKSIWLSLYGALVTLVLLGYFRSYPIPDFSLKFFYAAFSVVFIFSLGLLGKTILRIFFSRKTFNPVDSIVFSFGAGLGTFGLIVLVMGALLPGNLSVKFSLLGFFMLALLVQGLSRAGLEASFEKWSPSTPFSVGEVICIGMAAAGMGVSFLSAFSPITYYDSLGYHLALPALYNIEGAIRSVPTNLYSYFPANLEMVFMFIDHFFQDPDTVVNLLCWGVAFATGIGIYNWVSEFKGRRGGLFALALWWTAPVVLFLSVGGYVDMALAFFVFLSVRAFAKARERNWDAKWVALSGFFAGLACCVKYTGATCPIILGSFLLCSRIPQKEIPYKKMGLFFLLVLIPFSFWLVKNFAAIGNPVFPFFYEFLGGNLNWPREMATGYFDVLLEYGKTGNMIKDLISFPLMLVTSAPKFGGGFDVLGDFGWPVFLYASPLGLFFFYRNKMVKFIAIFLTSFFLIWFATKPVLRFLVPALPFAVMLSSLGLAELIFKKNRITTVVTVLLITPFLLSNFFIYFLISSELQPFSVALGLESKRDYLTRRLTYYPAYEFANQNFTNLDKILILGEQRTYHLKIPYLGSNFFAPSPASLWFNDAEDFPIRAKEHLKSMGITHILVTESELDRMGGLKNLGFTPSGIVRFKSFTSSFSKLVFDQNGVKIYSLKPPH